MKKIELEYLDLYAILNELYYNTTLQNPMGLHEFCSIQFDKYQPERLSVKTLFKGSDSLNSVETQREKSEEVSPPRKLGHKSNRIGK
jgi:hypothetical protein